VGPLPSPTPICICPPRPPCAAGPICIPTSICSVHRAHFDPSQPKSLGRESPLPNYKKTPPSPVSTRPPRHQQHHPVTHQAAAVAVRATPLSLSLSYREASNRLRRAVSGSLGADRDPPPGRRDGSRLASSESEPAQRYSDRPPAAVATCAALEYPPCRGLLVACFFVFLIRVVRVLLWFCLV
jgi:hypothetical protein